MPYQATLDTSTPAEAPAGGAPKYRYNADHDEAGAVTQDTSKTTAVTLNKLAGVITTMDVALAAAGEFEFAVNNSLVQEGDVVLACLGSGPSDNEHVQIFVTSVTAGAFTVAVTNLAAANQADGAITINFRVFKMPR